MKKKTIVIVSLTLVLAILAVAVIATFPNYLFEDTAPQGNSSAIQSGNIIENNGGQGDDVGILGDENDIGGTEGILPTPDDEELGYSEPDIKELDIVAQAKDAKVYAETGAFPEGTKVKFKKLGIFDKAYYRSRHYLKGVASEFTAYNLSAKNNGDAVLPNGTVKISFDIPEDYDSANVAVYYLLENGVQEIDCEISEDGKTAIVKISQTGVYILAEKTALKPEDNTSSDTTSAESDKTESGTSSDSSSSTDASSNTSSDSSDTSSDQSSSDTSSSSSDNSSEDGSSSTESDPEDGTLSDGAESDNTGSDDNGGDDNANDGTDDDNTSSDSTSSDDPNKETMDGWTPWH